MRHQLKQRSVGPVRYVALALILLLPLGCDPSSRIQERLDEISARVNDIHVPFRVQIPGGLCNSAGHPSANPRIVIDSDGSDVFSVNGVLIKRAPQNPVDFLFLSVNGLTIDGTFFETRTANLFDPLFGEFAVEQAADIMGMPVRRGGNIEDPEPGGNVPHHVVAEGAGDGDVTVHLFCRSDEQDLGIEAVLVTGWKRPRDTISVTYVPGQ